MIKKLLDYLFAIVAVLLGFRPYGGPVRRA